MKFGLSTACLYPQQTEKTIEYYCSHGVQVCEIFVNTFSEIERGYVKNLHTICDAAGLAIVSLHPFTSGFEPFMMFSDYPRRFDDFLEMHKLYFESCAILGGSIFVLHGDRRESNCPDERYFERYYRLFELGKTYGVLVAQENVVRCRSHSAEFITKMRAALGQDVCFVLDIKQAVRAKQDVFDMVQAMGQRLVHLHLSDHNGQADCLPIGKGTLDMKRLFALLQRVGFDGNVIIELYRENFNEIDELISSISHLESYNKGHK